MIDWKLIIGNEYFHKDLAELLHKPEIENIHSGIAKVDNIDSQGEVVFLFHTLHNTSIEEDRLSEPMKERWRKEPYSESTAKEQHERAHNFGNFFKYDVDKLANNQRIYEWETQLEQDINSDLIKGFKENKSRYLLFARLKKNRPFVYCGAITYHNHYIHKHHPARLISTIDIPEDACLSDELRELYNYKPPKEIMKEIKQDMDLNKTYQNFDSKLNKAKHHVGGKVYGDYAEEEGKKFYKNRGFEIEDKSKIKSSGCDFLAKRPGSTRIVEVKAKANYKNKKVNIKYEQIKKAQLFTQNHGCHYDLFILRGIEVDGKNTPSGGTIHLEMDFKPDIILSGKDFRSVDYTLREKNNNLKDFR